MKKQITIAIAIISSLSGCIKEIDTQKGSQLNPLSGNTDISAADLNKGFVAGEILVRFRTNVDITGINNALSKISGKIKEHVLTKTMLGSGDQQGFYLVEVPIGIATAIEKMQGLAVVENAEPNYIVSAIDESNDPYYQGTVTDDVNADLWGTYSDDATISTSVTTNEFGSQAEKAWYEGKTGSSGVIVGIIDAGIDPTHEDLQGNIWENPNETPNDGIDNDGNGYKDDTYGWNFVSNTNNPMDDNNHGTHVSGTIGAKGGNAKGVAGICWNIKLIAAKFLSASGSGTTANAVKAVDYITDLKSANPGIVATNNSWGGGSKSRELESAIKRANTANILFIAAAGNSNADMNFKPNQAYPACYVVPNIIAVASLDKDGARSSFSNYSSKMVHLGAPGRGIYSSTSTLKGAPYYRSFNGTSMAAPHVTGACALYKAEYPTATAAQIKNAIITSAMQTPTASMTGKTITNGRLDVMKALGVTP